MLPILFDKFETSFTSNGIGRLADCLSCIVTEERNGVYECEFKYPITGKWFDYMTKKGGVIACTHDDQRDLQPFDIYGYSAPIDGVVTFYAHHISYRLNRIVVRPFEATSAAEAMIKLQGQTYQTNPFSLWTDKVTTGSFKLDHPEVVRSLLGGSSGSILDVYGKGDYQFDKFAVKLYADRGEDSGVVIRYGKNLRDIQKEYDRSGTYNTIFPYWKGSDGTVVYGGSIIRTTPELHNWTDENGNVITDENENEIEFAFAETVPIAMDFSSEFEEQPTTAQLRDRASAFLEANQPWIPKENITVDFVQLWQTTEYADVAALQRVKLCDRVSVYYPELDVIAENQKVIKVVYNVLLDRFDSMELGEPRTSLTDDIRTTVREEIDYALPDGGVTQSMLQEAIDHATELITGGLGGHLVFTLDANGKPQEMLIMDTEDVDTAVNVIRINAAGIGFSTSGYDGPYRTAWTIDGSFVADFITSGTMNANLITAGVLSDGLGLNTWNLQTGEMLLQGNVVLRALGDSSRAAKMGSFTYQAYNIISDVVYTLSALGFKVAHGSSPDTSENYIGITTTQDSTKLITSSTDQTTTYYQAIHITKKNNVKHYLEERCDDGFAIYGANMDAATDKFLFKVDSEGIHYSNDFLSDLGAFVYNLHVGPGRIYLISDAVYENHETKYLQPWIEITDTSIAINSSKISGQPDTSAELHISESAFVLGSSRANLVGSDSYGIGARLEFCGRLVQVASSSSKRYKHGIADLKDETLDPHRLLKLPIRQFEYNENHAPQYYDMRGKTIPGFIAEEVDDVYPSATIHDKYGNIESWDERRIIPGMLALIQEQAKKIAELEKRIVKMEAGNEDR